MYGGGIRPPPDPEISPRYRAPACIPPLLPPPPEAAYTAPPEPPPELPPTAPPLAPALPADCAILVVFMTNPTSTPPARAKWPEIRV